MNRLEGKQHTKVMYSNSDLELLYKIRKITLNAITSYTGIIDNQVEYKDYEGVGLSIERLDYCYGSLQAIDELILFRNGIPND